jgi:hypothetical protein
VAAGWLAGGIGLATLVYGRLTAGRPRCRPWLAGAAVLALAASQWPALGSPGRALDGGPHPGHASVLDVADCFLPDIERSGRATVLAAVPVRTLTQWALLERCGRLDRLEEHWWGFGADGPGNLAGFAAWLRTTACDTVVAVERLPGKPLWESGPDCLVNAQLADALRRQDTFRLVKERDFPAHCCRVRVWRQPGGATAASPGGRGCCGSPR